MATAVVMPSATVAAAAALSITVAAATVMSLRLLPLLHCSPWSLPSPPLRVCHSRCAVAAASAPSAAVAAAVAAATVPLAMVAAAAQVSPRAVKRMDGGNVQACRKFSTDGRRPQSQYLA